MKVKHEATLFMLSFFALPILACILWLSLRTMEIAAVHESANHSYVLVRKFPLTDNGGINWWQENQNMLQERYGVPKPDNDGFFLLSFGILVMVIKKKASMTGFVLKT